MAFEEISPELFKENPFKLIGDDWMLITAGTMKSVNTMTASWGGLGILWNKNIAICFVRPTRHTFKFIEESDCFTLSFFEEKYRNILDYCGTTSGREVNKIAEAGLTPKEGTLNNIYFEEARLVIECRKIYYQDLNPENFLAPSIEKNYPLKDYHRMYVGEILRCLVKH